MASTEAPKDTNELSAQSTSEINIEDIFAQAHFKDAPVAENGISPDANLAEAVAALNKSDVLETRDITISATPVDSNGHCKINRFQDVPATPQVRTFPYSRLYKVQSTKGGVTTRTSGYALSPTRVLTSDVHWGNTNILVARLVSDGTSTSNSFAYADYSQSWGADARLRYAGLRYCILKLRSPIAITDSVGESISTIGHAQAFGANPNLTMFTHRPPGGGMTKASDNSPLERVNTGKVSDWYTTHLPGFAAKGSDNYMLGSPIFFTTTTVPITPGGPPSVKTYLVGVVTVGVVDGSDCTVDVGLFTDTAAITRLLADIPA